MTTRRRPGDPAPDPEQRRRTRRAAALERLEDAEADGELTTSQQTLRTRLLAAERADPFVTRDAEVRRLLGIPK